MTPLVRRRRGRRSALLLVAAAVAVGCGSGGSKTTAPTAPSTRTPASFDFGANDALRASAFGDSITQGELGDVGLRPRIPGLLTSPLLTRNNYPNNLQSMLRGLNPGWRVVNRGRGGELTRDGLGRLPGVLNADKPGFVLIMEGSNDATRELSAGTIVGNLDAMVGLAQNNHSVPVLATIPPNFRDDPGAQRIIAEANTMIRSLAAARGVVLAEIFDGMNDRALFGSPDRGIRDPLHPNERGYVVMAGIWFDAMQRAIPAGSGAIVTQRRR